jgi:multidrug efflux system membrane fusion protein
LNQSGEKRLRTSLAKSLAALLLAAGMASGMSGCKERSSSDGKKGSTAKGPPPPVAVVMGTVEQRDVPIYRDGLGTVQAFNTVTVRSRVDGQLQKLSFEEGQDMRAGEVVAQIDPAPFKTQVAQAEAKKAQDEAQLANAKLDLKRNETLLAGKIVSQEVYDTAQALVNQLAAAVQADQAAIDSASVQLNYSTVKAPIDGRTGIRLVDVGNIIRAADSNGIVVLTQLKPISVIFTLPEQSLAEVHQQLSQGEMKVLAVDRDNSTVLDEGKLAVVDNQIDTTTGTFRIKATFANDNLKLWPGQFVNARLLLKVRQGGAVVPASVVQRGPEGPYAFIVQNDMSVQMRKVAVGQIDHGEALIEDGLSPGERVVVDGQYKLQPGSKVKPAESSTPEGAPATTNVSPQKSRPHTSEIPNSKSQTPNKSQAPGSKQSGASARPTASSKDDVHLDVGVWSFFGIWNLELGTFRS